MAKYTGAFPELPSRGYFKNKDKGAQVKNVQRFINWANTGRKNIADLKIDGEYGPLTISAVAFFQEIHFLTIDGEFGPQCLATAKSMDLTGALKAINFAVAIAKDNRFSYGSGSRAHRSGCYFCQTNVGPRKKNKEKKGEKHYVKDKKGNKHTYARTYCCNTFITAAYAHGAGDPVIYKICHSGSCCGMEPSDWTRSSMFKKVGKCKSVAYSSLRPGDVIINRRNKKSEPHHVWMYIGGGKYVDASGNTWASNSIAVRGKAKTKYARYKKYKNAYVMRYVG